MVRNYCLELAAQAIQARLQYRVSLVSEMVWAGSFTASTMLFWATVISRFPTPNWTVAMLAVFLAYVELYWALSRGLFPGARYIWEYILRGRLDAWLCKPVDVRLVVLAKEVDLIALVRGLVLFCFWIGLAETLGAKLQWIGLFMGVLVCLAGSCIFALLFLTVGSLAFYIQKSDALDELVASTWEAARYPVDMLKGATSAVFTWLIPAAIVATEPAKLATGSGNALAAIGLTALLLVTWAVIHTAVWSRGLHRYESSNV